MRVCIYVHKVDNNKNHMYVLLPVEEYQNKNIQKNNAPFPHTHSLSPFYYVIKLA